MNREKFKLNKYEGDAIIHEKINSDGFVLCVFISMQIFIKNSHFLCDADERIVRGTISSRESRGEKTTHRDFVN